MPTSGIVGQPSTLDGLHGKQSASALHVAPSVVEFPSFERGNCYVATLNVQNTSHRVLRYRLTPPSHASSFQVLLRGQDLAKTENATVSLSTGLQIKYDIMFHVPEGDSIPAMIHDGLQIKGDDGSILEIPLMARRACPSLEVTPLQCKLGLVVLMQRSAQCVEVLNNGTRPGRYEVEVLEPSDFSSKATIKVFPEQGKLEIHEKVHVKVEAQGLGIGVFRGIVRVRIWEIVEEDDTRTDALPSAEKIVDVSGNVVEHTAELVLRQGHEPVKSLFFGSLFAGERRTIETLLRNNGPLPLKFKTSINFMIEEDQKDHEVHKELEITPEHGCIDPFSETLLQFIYHPRAKTLEELQYLSRHQNENFEESSSDSTSPFTLLSGPAQSLNAFASISCETLQAHDLTFQITAKTFNPQLFLSPSPPLDFGDVRSHDRVDMLLSIKNLSGLPIQFKSKNNIAHYSICPRVGRLDVLQSQNLVVSFTPTQLGTFDNSLILQVNDGIVEIPIKVHGRAAVVGSVPPSSERFVGGPYALPADFAPKYHFLLPEQAKQTKGKLSRRFQRQPPYERAALNGTAAVDEFELQGTNNTHLTYCVKELARRADHRAAYHEYLTQCRVQREAKSKNKGKAYGLKKHIAQSRGSNQENDVNLGMEKLTPPTLKLPQSIVDANEPLWLCQHPTDGNVNLFFDALKLIPRKYKTLPATPAELADCAQSLETSELNRVLSGPKTLNFGRVCINVSTTRGLTVQNDLSRNVLVNLHLESQQIGDSFEEVARKTLLTSQVIPPHSKAGFDIVFCSLKEQSYQQVLTYSLNRIHFRQVTLMAEVAPIVVEVTPFDLLFQFDDLDLNSSISRDVVISNTSDCDALFNWTRLPLVTTFDGLNRPESSKSNATTMAMTDRSYGNNTAIKLSVYDINPASGVLKPLASLVCKVIYTPPSMTKATRTALGITQKSGSFWLTQSLQLDVTGGKKCLLNCRALVPEIKVGIRDKTIDFGTISVGLERTKTFVLHNNDIHNRAVVSTSFELLSTNPSIGLQVVPSQSFIAPQESLEILVKLVPYRAITLDMNTKTQSATVIVTIRGGIVYRLPIFVSVVIPDILLVPSDIIDFGQVVLGVSVSRILSFTNQSSISASLQLDLSALQEFDVIKPRRYYEDTSNSIEPLFDDKMVNGQCTKWKLHLLPHTSLDLNLIYTPLKVHQYDLILPLEIANTSMTLNGFTILKRRLQATGISPRLRFSTSSINFSRCIVIRDNNRNVRYTKTIVLTNDVDESIEWRLDTTCLRRGNLITFATGAAESLGVKECGAANPTHSATSTIFHIAPNQGELAPGEAVTLYVNFIPLDAVEYAEENLPLLINDESYANFTLRGEGVTPHLSFSTNKVILATVPLGVTTKMTFQVFATGYESFELTYRVALDTSRVPLTVVFPQGKRLSRVCESVPVEVQFTSTSSIAFNTRLEFLDPNGTSFHLPIAGCTENSFLTTYRFFQLHNLAPKEIEDEISKTDSFCFYTHTSGQFPIYLLSKQQAQEEIEKKTKSLSNGFISLNSMISHEDTSDSTQFSKDEIEFLMQYLNSTFLQTPIHEFPEDFANTRGRPLYEFLDLICSKTKGEGLAIPSRNITESSTKRKNSLNCSTVSSKNELTQLLTQYLELLRFLRSYGAMVHDVYPEYLLSQDFYLKACENPHADPALFTIPHFTSLTSIARRQLLINEWRTVSTTAWMKVIYQVMKCFLFSRITSKGYQLQMLPNYNSKSESSGCDDKSKSDNSLKRMCLGSNVYSEAEMVLIQWLCDCIRTHSQCSQSSAFNSFKEGVLETQMLDMRRDLQDGQWLFHLVAAYIPTLSTDQAPYQCFRWNLETFKTHQQTSRSTNQLQQKADVLLQILNTFGLDFGMNPKRFLLHFTGREMFILLLHLYQTLPQFLPKATIDFQGTLGQKIEKNIELQNPSQRPLRYHVFLLQNHNGASQKTMNEFTLESNELLLEAGKTGTFRVTFQPRFSRQLRVRLVFQAVRDDTLSFGGTGATMVFMLESNIVARKPVRIFQIETKTYEKRIEELVIENQFPCNASYKVLMTQKILSLGTETFGTNETKLSSSQGVNRRRSVQASGRKHSLNDNSNSDATTLEMKPKNSNNRENGDFQWCINAQPAFYLPDFNNFNTINNNSDTKGEVKHLNLAIEDSESNVLSIQQKESTKLKIEFLPFHPGNYCCQLLFIDEKIGEFLYEVHGIATLPTSLETLEFQCDTSNADSKLARLHFIRELTIPISNILLHRALSTILERTNGPSRVNLQNGLKQCEESHHHTFSVTLNSPYFTLHIPELTLTCTSKSIPVGSERSETSQRNSSRVNMTQARLGTPRSVVAGLNSILLDFQPKGAGCYRCKLLLRSQNTICGSSDVRVYDIVATVKERQVQTQLDFVSPARQSIVQDIPISNPTETSWLLQAIFGTSNLERCSMFSGPASLIVPAKRSATYPLTFTPLWIKHETRTFVLVNNTTQEQFEFQLSGHGEEPLAQDHIVLNCQARTNIVHEFQVFTLPGGEVNVPQIFQVESDLCHVIGPSTITVPPGINQSVKYPLTFTPLISGLYFGSITFIHEVTKEYLWYTIEATVSPPEPETTLEMHTIVREAIGVEIKIFNPLETITIFQVKLQGHGLIGSATLTLEPHETKVYELLYSPLVVTMEEGAIMFSNDNVGEFWYRLDLVANEAKAQQVDEMVCAVGEACSQLLSLENPSNHELHLQYHISNTRNFSIQNECVIIPPFGRENVSLNYTPSSLLNVESTSIVFFEKDVVSDWEFIVQGRGQPPSVMKPLVITAQVNEIVSTLFMFKNPFAVLLQVNVELVIDKQDTSTHRNYSSMHESSVFELLLKKRHLELNEFEVIQVPISFQPLDVSEQQAQLVFHGKEEFAELEWRYPLRGIAEAPLHPRIATILACSARECVEKRVECELLAAPDDMELENESFTVEWEIDTKHFGPLTTVTAIERALTVTPEPISSKTNSAVVLVYLIRFEPLRSYRGSITLLIKKKSGGLWRFDVSLDATDPPIDDVLTIESSLNQTSSVSFQLCNQFRESAAFLADFSAGSSSAFTVYPVQGELPPYESQDGAVFVVSFTPTGYGKMQSGQLVILTEEMQWTFNVKGVYPDAKSSSKSSGLTSSLTSSASRRRLGITKTSNGRGDTKSKR
ncbi:uncharacterized protein PHALS_07349 [Plasmopara halstedii]|uniref:Calponin-homology (CH) domain-containing protein n=1 Tax=Plasmopara halstedii TaxID=4781 RepID=A0A0P1B5S0_PLAHL|nr:uncharacterized protein PHALS_07349 [Plasmopara halstedii]CEG49593.1 hypothetical protein PHALS_07349 [Plasmopara halstedii]|eukprot:XP_024585962.1 hypothetical protein PHALS_07349 [Plasmopara halstedii]